MRAIPFSSDSDVSFREMSARICLGGILAVYIPYFAYTYRLFEASAYREDHLMTQSHHALSAAILLQAIVTAGANAIVALRCKPEDKDERDAAIESRSFRYAYIVLVVLLFTLGWSWPYHAGVVAFTQGSHLMEFPLMIQILMLAFVSAEATKYLVRVVGYRRGR